MSVRTVSLDLGNALCKGYRGPGTSPVVFPNQIATDRNNALREFAGFLDSDPLIVELESGRAVVGDSAARLSRAPRAKVGYARYSDPDFPYLIAAMLCELYPVIGGQIALAFSLPVDGFGQAQQQTRRLAGQWNITHKSAHNLTFDIPANLMQPIPEAFGSICFLMLSQDGARFNDLDLAEQRIAVIDIGGYTVDILTFRELNLEPIHGSVERGVIQVKADINREIKHRYNRKDLDPRDLESLLQPRDGCYTYTHAGDPQDVTDIVEAALWELTQGVLEIWHNELAGGVDYDSIIFTGGGAPLVRPFLESQIQHAGIRRIDDQYSHVANVIGAWRFAQFRRVSGL